MLYFNTIRNQIEEQLIQQDYKEDYEYKLWLATGNFIKTKNSIELGRILLNVLKIAFLSNIDLNDVMIAALRKDTKANKKEKREEVVL